MTDMPHRALAALKIAHQLPSTLEGALQTLDDARRIIERLYRDLSAGENAHEDRAEAE